MSQTKTPLSPEESKAISRLRALGQGVKVYCLDPDKVYCVPSSAGDGSAYSILVDGDFLLCSWEVAARLRDSAEAMRDPGNRSHGC